MEAKFIITIPADEEGYILQKCPVCDEYFKIDVNDINIDKYSDIFCLARGLICGFQ